MLWLRMHLYEHMPHCIFRRRRMRVLREQVKSQENLKREMSEFKDFHTSSIWKTKDRDGAKMYCVVS